MKYLSAILAVIVLIFIVLYSQRPSRIIIKEPTTKLDSLQRAARQSVERFKKDSTQFADTIQVLRDNLERLQASRVKSKFKQATTQELDSAKDGLLGELVIFSDTTYCMDLNEARVIFSEAAQRPLLDSIISEQRAIISLMDEDKISTWNNFNQLITIERDKTAEQEKLTEYYKGLTEQLQKENKRERRRGRLAKVLIPVGFVLGLMI